MRRYDDKVPASPSKLHATVAIMGFDTLNIFLALATIVCHLSNSLATSTGESGSRGYVLISDIWPIFYLFYQTEYILYIYIVKLT